MKNYHFVAKDQDMKYEILAIIRAVGAVCTGVSGYGSGYYIQLDATPDQVEKINLCLEVLMP